MQSHKNLERVLEFNFLLYIPELPLCLPVFHYGVMHAPPQKAGPASLPQNYKLF